MEAHFYYVGGMLKNGILETIKYKIPELEVEEREIRNPEGLDKYLIKNKAAV